MTNPGTPKRPNILWICTDPQRFDTLGCYANPFVRTPNIDRMAWTVDPLPLREADC
jgi:arylsulfatase A-like enzyme